VLDKTITVDDLFDAGRRLQLAVYGAQSVTMRSPTGKVPTNDAAFYWYISVKGGFERVQLTVDDHAQDALIEVVTRIDEGVRAGCSPRFRETSNFFGDYDNCGYCAYNSLCPSSRDVVAASKSGSPVLARYNRAAPRVGGVRRMTQPLVADQGERDRLRQDFDRTLFVEAGRRDRQDHGRGRAHRRHGRGWAACAWKRLVASPSPWRPPERLRVRVREGLEEGGAVADDPDERGRPDRRCRRG